MRVRTEDRRKAILKVAKDVFREVGFERASMANISSRVGGSKTTLYGYFRSKEELFAAAMIDALDDQGKALLDLLDPANPNVALTLRRFGEAYLRLVTSPEALAVTRTAVAEVGTKSKLGAHLYELGPRRGLTEIAAYLAKLDHQGVLQIRDPLRAAAQFKALIEAGILEPLLYGAKGELPLKDAVANAVVAFLRVYETPAQGAG
jgi:AcrR family transcriptional regulator